MEGTNDMKEKTIIYVLVSLFWLGSNYVVYNLGGASGATQGIKAYHAQCYTIGGYIIDDQGHVVVCMGQGQIPKEELPNFKSTI
jgi:hypothetical protein